MSRDHTKELLALFFDDSFDALEEWERVCLKLQPTDDLTALEPVFRCAHNIKGGAGLVGMTKIYEKMHAFEDYLVKIRDLGLALTPDTVNAILSLEKLIRGWLEQARLNPSYEPDTSQVENEFETLLRGKGTVHANASITPKEPLAPSAETSEKAIAAARASILAQAPAAPDASADPHVQDETLRVPASRLDHLVQLVGELALHQNILERAARENALQSQMTHNVIGIMSKLTLNLQDAALTLRMIPVEGLFQKVERAVRETSSQLRKVVSIIRRGDDVMLDKLVVDRMLDPLIHIARNAVDHGIESIQERTALAKRPNGLIRISAENSTGGVTLTFEDDGRGIDPEKVFQKALDRGLVDADQKQEMSELAKQMLIFLPGLSTAEKVSEVSGRGIGMDVVASVVNKMGGRVELTSTPGLGTRFTMTLPTNLSILDALVIKIAGCQYAIPNQELKEVINLNDPELEDIDREKDSLNLRGRKVPLRNMSEFLPQNQGPIGAPPNHDLLKPGIVVQFREDLLALAVDQVLGPQQVFVRPVIDSLTKVNVFGGSTILSDGEPSIILNLTEMARQYFESA